MARAATRLSAEDWERAAVQAIADGGLQAVAIEPLARRLGVTKGSFYAHFRDRDALVEAALRRWEQLHVDAFAAALRRREDPTEQLHDLIALATGAARSSTIQGRLLLESEDPRVLAALRRVTVVRLVRLEEVFRRLGLGAAPAARRATIAYAAYVGFLQLAREVPDRLAQERALAKDLRSMLASG